MAQRIWIALTLLVASLVALRIGLAAAEDFPLREALVNVGTDLVSLALTVALIDLLLERRRREESRRKIAWQMARALDRAVWVWQGGWREFQMRELLRLLIEVQDADPLPNFTVDVFEAVGRQAEDLLYSEGETVAESKTLDDALRELAKLTDLRHARSVTPSTTALAKSLINVAVDLASILRVSSMPFSKEIVQPSQDATLEAQRARYESARLGP